MKKEFLLSVVFGSLLISLIAGIGFPSDIASSNINVVSLRTNPYPAEPGQYMDIWIQVENTGDAKVNNFKFTLEPEYPFSFYKGENATRYISTLGIYEPVVLKYKLYVDENAVEGWNDLKYKYNAGNVWVEMKTKIYIAHKPRLELVSVNPSEIEIGKTSNISLTVKNMGHAEARNIKVELNTLSTDVKVVGSDTRYVSSLDVDDEKSFNYKIVSDSSNTGVELVPVTIYYEDLNGTQQSFMSYIGLNIIGEPNINVILRDEYPKPSVNGKSDISVEVINSGPVQAKFVYVNASTPAGEIEKDKVYVGDLDSDDFDIVDFNIHLKDTPGRKPLYVTVSYQNPEYKNEVISKTIYFDVEKNSQNSSNTYIFLGVVVALVVVLFLLRGRKHRRG